MLTIKVIHNGVEKEMAVRRKAKPGLGDRVETFLGKIPGVKKLPCYDKNGKLKPDSGCGKRKVLLNKLGSHN